MMKFTTRLAILETITESRAITEWNGLFLQTFVNCFLQDMPTNVLMLAFVLEADISCI